MLRRFIPSSLFIRFTLIIVLPTIFAQLIATYIFYNRHWESVSKNMSLSLANDINVAFEIPNISSSQRKQIYANLGIDFKIIINKNPKQKPDSYAPEAEFLYRTLKQNFPVPIQIYFTNNHDHIKIDIFLKNNIYSFTTNSKRIDNPTTYIFILWMTGTSIIFLLLSIIFTRNQIRPIIKLARAADKFGKGQHSLSLQPEGAKEIRKAATAFLKMKERIERQIGYRTEMLAGVSHDLRTPLTRMKLQLAISNDPELNQMLNDVKDMEIMINSYLDFARGDMKEISKIVLLNKFITQITGPYLNQDQKIIIKNIPNIKIALKINALKRCFQNLFDNAFKYGSQAIINAYVNNDELYIEIHDNGPGIPLDKYEEVFRPFFRLEESRNSETGGVGLGLAITRDIISNHGGQIFLEPSDLLPGLKVVITLPL